MQPMQPSSSLPSQLGAVRTRPAAAPEIGEPLLKRPFDALLSGLGLLCSAPLWVLIACAIKLEDGGPVFFRQERWGQGKRPIRVYKFRTMIPNAHRVTQAAEDDPRITRVGRILRDTALDEMPQLLNIWKGDLPMNERQVREGGEEVSDEQIPGFEERLRIRPGLTGIAQIWAPRDVPRRHKFKYDVFYLKKQSFWLDLKLIALSFWITFRARWEVRGQKY
jgi:lipopolysaccharide/colanic/teichoic acid biosynthesis glycosyltransferase